MEMIIKNNKKEILRIFKAIFWAAFVPALIMTGFFNHWAIFPMAFVMALIHVIILGLPIYFILKKCNLITWYYCALGGLLAGGLFPLIIFFQERTLNLIGLNELISMGGLGAIGGFSGWFAIADKFSYVMEKVRCK